MTCQLCREMGRIISKVSYVPRFQKDPGSVFARSPDGLKAVNAAGLPVDVFAAMLRELEKDGDEYYIRNAKLSDRLGPGAWYVLTPKGVNGKDT